MDVVRVSAKTVEDALTEASIELGTSSDNIEYTVIDEGSKGFFGIGGRKAVIEAKRKVSEEDLIKEIFEEKPKKAEKPKKEYKEYKKESKKEYKQDKKEEKETKKEQKKDPDAPSESKKDSRKESRRDSDKNSEKNNTEKNYEKTGEKKESDRDRKNGKAERKGADRKESGSAVREETVAKEGKTAGGRESSRKESGSAKSRDVTRKDTESAQSRDYTRKGNESTQNREYAQKESDGVLGSEKTDKSVEETGSEAFLYSAELMEEKASVDMDASTETVAAIPKTPADPEEAKSRAITFVKSILSAMGMDDEVTAAFEEDTLCVNIEGENMGIMIGKRGQTLDSLQYLTSLVVNKGKSSYVRVKVDTEDYRNRRKATLENLAKNIAFKVKKTGKPVFLEPMNPYERRIIHAALQNDPYVTTHSEGEEPYRKVVVTLKKERERDHDRNDRGDRGGDRRRNYSRYNNHHSRGNRQDYDRDSKYRRGNYMQEFDEAEEVQTDTIGVGTGISEDESEE